MTFANWRFDDVDIFRIAGVELDHPTCSLYRRRTRAVKRGCKNL